VTKIGTRNVGYWINAVAQGGEDYYSKPGEAPGVWQGRLASRLDLSGEVDHDDYMAIFAGKDPRSGAQLLQRPARRRWVDAAGRNRKADPVLGYDLRFAAPKSVSLLWAVGDREASDAVLRAHDRGVAEALRYLEDVACWVQRDKGGKTIERGTGFVGMGFLHRSSRAGDPALHTHLLISNLTRAERDGKWLSLASPKGRMPLWLHAKAAGHIYQAVLRAEVTRELGLGWGKVTNGHADLTGFDREMIEHFSRRREEIVKYMTERGVSSAAAAEVAAYRTRAEKDYGVDADRQLADWIARAAEFGLTPDSIREMISEALGREPRPIDSEDRKTVLDDIEAHHSHFGRRELICAISTRMVEGADADAIRMSVDRVLSGERVVGLRPGGPAANSNFTTARLLEMEEKIVAAATEGREAGASVIDEATFVGVLARHHYLGDEQAEMVRRLTTGGERVAVVAARPGTGKTTAMRAAAEGWAAAGFRGIGVSTARSATVEIAEVGLPATSIAKLRIMLAERDERGRPALPPGAVIVVDEASTASTEDIAWLLERVEACDGKLVLMGDTRQIGAVAAGGVYADLSHRLEAIELTEIRRQRDPVDRRVVVLAHEGRGSDALDVMEASGRLRIAPTHPEALDALALDWHRGFAAGEDAVMIARRNEDVRRLNETARAFREDAGELGERITVGGVEFAVGDVVMTRVNASEASNRERWVVIGVDHFEGAIGVVKISAPDVGATLSKTYLEKTTANGGPALEHAYAMTTYAAQGKTFDKVDTLLDPGVSREDFLVAVSRAREETVGYVVASRELVDADLGPSTREISDHLHDVRAGSERVASEYAAVEVEDRSAIESMPAAALAAYRLTLIRDLDEAAGPTVADDRLAALEARIESGRSRLDSLGDELRQAGDDRGAREAITTRLRQGERQLARLEAERANLSGEEKAPPEVATIGKRRYNLELVDERMTQLRRMAVAAERIESTRPVLDSLGPRPEDPHRAEAWAEGVDLIHGFRLRWGIDESDLEPLGGSPGDAARQEDRRQTERQLTETRLRLDLPAAEVAPSLEISR
jgi:conjugative relaxase-like TrwC/TraI family protein